MSRSRNFAHRSIRPLPVGVPVSPTMRLTLGRTFIRARKRFAWWLLKLESSSTTTISHCHRIPLFSMSHGTFSRLMMWMSACFCKAAFRSASVPTSTANRRADRCSHFSISAGQVSLATRRGAMTRTRRTSNRSNSRSLTAVSVITVLLTQAHIQQDGGNGMLLDVSGGILLIAVRNELHPA